METETDFTDPEWKFSQSSLNEIDDIDSKSHPIKIDRFNLTQKTKPKNFLIFNLVLKMNMVLIQEEIQLKRTK